MEPKTIYILTAIVIAAVLAMVVVIILYFWRNKRSRRTSSGAKSITKVESVEEEVDELKEMLEKNEKAGLFVWSKEDYALFHKTKNAINRKLISNEPLSSKESGQKILIDKVMGRK